MRGDESETALLRPARRRLELHAEDRHGVASLLATVALLACPGLGASASAAPIISLGVSSLPSYRGHAAQPHRIDHVPRPEQNPFMAPNPNSNIHNDTWMTDAYRRAGPLGRSPVSTSQGSTRSALCGSLAFDSAGRIVTVCPSIPYSPQARIIDPDTLETLATYDLPNAPDPPARSASSIPAPARCG